MTPGVCTMLPDNTKRFKLILEGQFLASAMNHLKMMMKVPYSVHYDTVDNKQEQLKA